MEDDFKQITTNNPDYDHLQRINVGFQSALAIEMAGKLRLFDGIAESGAAGVTVDQLVTWGGDWDHSATERLVNALTSISLLKKDRDTFHLTGSGRLLVSTENSSLAGMFARREMTTEWYTNIVPAIKKELKQKDLLSDKSDDHDLPKSSRLETSHQEDDSHRDEGGNEGATEASAGGDAEDAMWGSVEMFRELNGHLRYCISDLLTAYDLSKYKSAVDLGAGSGAVTFELARLYPDMHVTLFEMPKVVAVVKEHFLPPEGAPNVTMLEGDFNKDDLPKSDIYIMGNILHDKSDEQIDTLLRRIIKSVNPGGALIVVEKLLDNDRAGPAVANLFDLLFIAEEHGHVRTAAEYQDRFAAHGFTRCRVGRTSALTFQDIIIATKD